jgi:hypothetical protein
VSVTLDKVVPWGRSLDEYVRMFDLTDANLQSRILDCAAGPSSFNAELHRRGHASTNLGPIVVSCDPIYTFSGAEIRRRVNETYGTMVTAAENTRERFVWREIESPEHLGNLRMAAVDRFLEDYPTGLRQGRYHAAELPALPFRDGEFDLALCSHFLFTYSDILSFEFHPASIRELCRVAGETRIFPLLPNFGNAHSPHVAAVVRQLEAEGYSSEVRRVPYEFQKGGNEMLGVSRLEGTLRNAIR